MVFVRCGPGVEGHAAHDGQAGGFGRFDRGDCLGQLGHRLDDQAVGAALGQRVGLALKESNSSSSVTSPIITILPLGPIEPKTLALLPAVRLLMAAPSRLKGTTSSPRSCRPKTNLLAPKVLVSRICAPASA